MSEPLFYAETLGPAGATVTLAGDEARHAAGARRLRAGDALWLFDGRGALARATLLAAAKRDGTLTLRIEERRDAPPPPRRLHLACAPPKGDRQAVLLDMATQLGMTDFTPLACARAVAAPGANAAARWRRVCLEACKQSRRLHLPAIHAEATPAAVAAAGGWVLIAHPSGAPLAHLRPPESADKVTLLIGPEGGFTDDEVAAATAAGARAVSLGEAILRIETAAVALLAALALGGPALPG
jgi:16S rRNA (uracil1498-N3)-methyltransferase